MTTETALGESQVQPPSDLATAPIAGVYPPAPKDYRQEGPFWWVLGLGTLILWVAMAFDVWLGRPVEVSTPAAASGVLVLAGALAVAIERLLEFFWGLMDQMAANPSWPFSGEAKRLEEFSTQVSEIVAPTLNQARRLVTSVDATAQKTPQAYENVKTQTAALQAAVDSIVNAKDPNAGGGLVTLKKGLDDLGATLGHSQARASVIATSDAVDSLKRLVDCAADDPGRRIMSLLVGMIIGVIAAGVLGLDVIHAALGVPAKSISLWSSPSLSVWWSAGLAAWPWGMLATGIAIGLGSSPLHELVGAIQKWKQAT